MLKQQDFIKKYLTNLQDVIARISADDLAEVIILLENISRKPPGFSCKNGGSAKTAGSLANGPMLGVQKQHVGFEPYH